MKVSLFRECKWRFQRIKLILWLCRGDSKKDIWRWMVLWVTTDQEWRLSPLASPKLRSCSSKCISFLTLTLFCAFYLNQVALVISALTLAISIPSVHGRPTKGDSGSKTTRGKHTRTRSKKMSQSVTRFQSLLIEARQSIEAVFDQACIMCPSTLAPIVGLLLGEARLLSSIVSEPENDQNILALKTIMLLGILRIKKANSCRSLQECNVST
jgi:hypothetical protein